MKKPTKFILHVDELNTEEQIDLLLKIFNHINKETPPEKRVFIEFEENEQ